MTFEIRKGVAGPKALISAPICRAYELLRERRTVTTAEFALVCFGIHRFDPVIHDSKIFNLLARMRALAPRGLALGVKSGSVFAEGSEETWAKISFSRRHALASGLRDSDEWRAFLARPPAGQKPASTDDRFVKPSLILRRLAGRDDISRLELEKLIGKSRATSHRLIARWLRQGYLRKKGKARNTRYAIVALRKGNA